jgi:integrase
MKEARAFLESGEAHKARFAPHGNGIQTVHEATDLWLKLCETEGLNGRAPVTRYTLKNYRYRAEYIFQYEWPKPLQALTPPDVVEFRSWLTRSGVSRYMARKVLTTLHSVFKEMTIRGIVQANVAQGISIRADTRYEEPITIPSRQEIAALLKAADDLASCDNIHMARTWQKYRPILYLAVDSGMRPQEYLALKWSDFDAYGVHVRRAIEGDNKAISVPKTPAGRRYIELSAFTIDLIREYVETHAKPNPHDLIFSTANGGWLNRNDWQRRGFSTACKHAGLTKTETVKGKTVTRARYRPYDLRHFFASVLIEKETNLKRIQALMGHKNIETTLNVYGHLLDDGKVSKKHNSGLVTSLL